MIGLSYKIMSKYGNRKNICLQQWNISKRYIERTAMTEIQNVTIIKEANIYFGGNVTSRTVLFPDGSKKTLGIMLPGDYEFGTAEKEIMEILAGELEVRLPDSDSWTSVKAGDSFEVPAQSTFALKVMSVTDYCCSYMA